MPDVSSEKLYEANCSSIPAACSNAGTKEEEARITHSALQEEMHRMSDLPTQPTNTVARAMLPENKDSAYKACFRKRAGSICHRLTTVSTLHKQGFRFGGFWDSQTVHRASKVNILPVLAITFVLLSLLKDSPKKKNVLYMNSSKARTTVLRREHF